MTIKLTIMINKITHYTNGSNYANSTCKKGWLNLVESFETVKIIHRNSYDNESIYIDDDAALYVYITNDDHENDEYVNLSYVKRAEVKINGQNLTETDTFMYFGTVLTPDGR